MGYIITRELRNILFMTALVFILFDYLFRFMENYGGVLTIQLIKFTAIILAFWLLLALFNKEVI